AHADAEACTRRALQLSPGHLDALTMLGLALQGQSKHVEAVDVWSEVTRRDPQRLLAWANFGTVLRTQRRFDEALVAYARAAALGANSPDFLYNVGLLHQERGDYEHALRLLSEAHAAAPLDAQIALQFAQCNYELLQTEDALAAIRDWTRFERLDDSTLADLVLLLLNLGEGAEAKEALHRLLRAPQPSPHALLRLAQYMERSNRVEEARDGLLALQGDARSADLGEELSLLEAQLAQRARRHEEAARTFGKLAEQCREPERRHLYLYPLAKSFDALGRYEEAFQTLQQAHLAQLEHLHRIHPETAGLDEPPMLITRRSVAADDVANWKHTGAPDVATSPVFIVAFPRSGTTLLEQALDAHPQLVTMDEQPFLQGCIDDLVDAGADYPQGLAALPPTKLAEIRARYFRQVARKVQIGPGQRLLDKNPLNLLRLPAIRRLFPASPVLLAIRHPADVVLSCYQQHFRAPEFALMCRDLPTLARSFRRAFDYWYSQSALLSGPVHELRYEDLVRDFEPGMREIAAFLQLPWDDAMLEPAAQARRRGYISTPSYSQVVEPVHTKSVGRWRNYAAHFEGARAELAGHAARWGYDFGNSR
ncbi:MAG: sulfotransferase, partial [Steroidobacteraceae bacterium]